MDDLHRTARTLRRQVAALLDRLEAAEAALRAERPLPDGWESGAYDATDVGAALREVEDIARDVERHPLVGGHVL